MNELINHITYIAPIKPEVQDPRLYFDNFPALARISFFFNCMVKFCQKQYSAVKSAVKSFSRASLCLSSLRPDNFLLNSTSWRPVLQKCSERLFSVFAPWPHPSVKLVELAVANKKAKMFDDTFFQRPSYKQRKE